MTDALSRAILAQRPELAGQVHYVNGRPWCDGVNHTTMCEPSVPVIGDTRACPDCGRPQHYTGLEHGWAHDAAVDTWDCADPRKASA